MADFSKLDMGTLKRYKRHYKLRTKHNSNKTELAATVSKHFSSQAVLEMETISFFVYAVKNQGIDDDLWCLKQLIPPLPPSHPVLSHSQTRCSSSSRQRNGPRTNDDLLPPFVCFFLPCAITLDDSFIGIFYVWYKAWASIQLYRL